MFPTCIGRCVVARRLQCGRLTSLQSWHAPKNSHLAPHRPTHSKKEPKGGLCTRECNNTDLGGGYGCKYMLNMCCLIFMVLENPQPPMDMPNGAGGSCCKFIYSKLTPTRPWAAYHPPKMQHNSPNNIINGFLLCLCC